MTVSVYFFFHNLLLIQVDSCSRSKISESPRFLSILGSCFGLMSHLQSLIWSSVYPIFFEALYEILVESIDLMINHPGRRLTGECIKGFCTRSSGV